MIIKGTEAIYIVKLNEDALDSIPGYAESPDIYELEAEEVEAFDSTFPSKEKCVQESQKEFEVACAMLDE